MKLHGDILDNLRFALMSASRLRGHRVHPDTLQFWRGLIARARQELGNAELTHAVALKNLIVKLETEIAERETPQP